jgi:cytochrome c peroxidase
MTVWNSAYMRTLHFDGNRASLEEQADKAIPGINMGQPYPALFEELGAIPEYKDRFARVFPDGITEANITKAIAAFERSLLTFRSPFDRYRAGDTHALSAEQKEGMDLFFSARTACSSCHVAPLFTDNAWHNLGVPQVGPKAVDHGRADVTKNPADTGAFKTPMLRNIELTGPYMHDGVFSTLEQVVAFYVGGGGPGPTKSPLVKPLDLSPKEQKALVAFLRSLTDPTAHVDPPPRLP